MHAAAAKMKLDPERALTCPGLPPELEAFAAGFAPASTDGPVVQAVLFVRDAMTLATQFDVLLPRLAPDSKLWIAYPKKSGSIPTDLSRDQGWDVLAAAGYVQVTQVAVDADWSALRFKKREAVKTLLRDVPLAARSTAGVDYEARIVTLPPDVVAALGALLPVFQRHSFTCQKEWAEAVADAKKPETRARRIGRLVEAMAARSVKSTS